MSMTKKDFESLAEVLALASSLDEAIQFIADVCEQSNPNFRRRQFMAVVRNGQAGRSA